MTDNIDTTTEPVEDLTVPADTSSVELTDADRANLDTIHPDLGPGASSWLARKVSPQNMTTLESNAYLRVNLDDGLPQSLIQPWHSIATPTAVLAARERLDQAIEADLTARAEFANIRARETAEQDAIGRAAVAGAEIPPLTDWMRERLVQVARHRVLAQQVKQARRAYSEAVKAALPQWRADLVAAIKPARQAAREAFRGVPEAVATWRRTIEAAHAVDSALHKDDVLSTRMKEDARKVAGAGAGATSALAAYLSSSDPVISGSYLKRTDPLRPTRYEREAMNETASGGSQLAAIEAAEKGRYTQLERTDRNAHFYSLAPDNQSTDVVRERGPVDRPFANESQA